MTLAGSSLLGIATGEGVVLERHRPAFAVVKEDVDAGDGVACDAGDECR